MLSALLPVTLVVLGSVVQRGNAVQKCPVPPESILVYLDMEKISLMKIQHDFAGVFQEPKICTKDNHLTCIDQRCCRDEVGCCYTDTTTKHHINKCGCKEKSSNICTFPAPLAILGKSECNSDNETTFVTCLRERRYENSLIWGKNTTEKRVMEVTTNLGKRELNFDLDIDNEIKIQIGISTEINKVAQILQHMSVKQLADSWNKTMIENFLQYIAERKTKGEPNGLPE